MVKSRRAFSAAFSFCITQFGLPSLFADIASPVP